MDFQAFKDFTTEANFNSLGTVATVTRPWDAPIAARVIWLRTIQEDSPAGHEYTRRGARWVVAVRQDEVPLLQRGSIISSAGPPGSTIRNWKVDGMESVTRECFYAIVVPEAA